MSEGFLLHRSKNIVHPLSVILLAFSAVSLAYAQGPRPMTGAEFEKIYNDASNWGRWGENDELGTLNLITPATRRDAATLVVEGVSISLARIPEEKIAADNPDPFVQTMLKTGNEPGNPWAVDNYSARYHGFAHTHMDSLCHLLYRDKLYNGFSKEQITKDGTKKLSIHNIRGGIFARGLLIDIPALRGVDFLQPGDAIYPEELDAWVNRAGIEIKPGDVVFFRTGRWAARKKLGPWNVQERGAAGLHASCGPWLRKHDFAMVGSDAAMDVMPSGVEGVTHPIHVLTLNAMGVHIFDNCDLEDVSKACAKFKRWEFLLNASPIPVKGGTGSPLNPIATF